MNRSELLNTQINMIKELKEVQKSAYLEDLNTLSDRLNDKIFRVAVVGEFSSGKSTFINSIIGKDVLKHAATETTATVTYIYNVSIDDKRINTCEIVYNDGNTINLPDLEKLRDYTTVNSEINVAESIASVSIYVNFLNVSYPIVITDTPGLNGIADKHREITLDEIKKAHACIYLLSINGVKSSDMDFINILLNYQSRFIFIQNFIDLLRSSEGETIKSKIQKDKENIDICIKNQNNEINYDIFGISAAKALASKDLSKEKVFEEDKEIITDRKKLFEESNISSFENCLYEIVNSGEYLKVIEDSVSYTLRQIIERIKNNLHEECELNEHLKTKDEQSVKIEKIKKIITRINSQKDDQKKRLENFLISRDSENRRSLYEYIDRCLETLNDSLHSDLDEKVKTYEEFITFSNYYGEEPPAFYGKYISNYINGRLIPDVDNRIQDNLSHLYDEAILRVSDFITIVPKTKDTINVKINNSVAEFTENNIQTEFEKYKIETQTKLARIKSIESSINDMKLRESEVQQDINSEKQKNKSDKLKYEKDRQRLGADPGVKQKSVMKTRTVARTGLFSRFRDWLFGEKTETYWAYEPDYTEQNEWKRRKAKIEDQNRRVQDSYNKRINSLKSQKKQLQDEISLKSNDIERLHKDILDLENRAKREKEIYERTLKANKQEYCQNEKRKLKEEIYRILLGEENNDSAVNIIHRHIDTVDLNYLPMIQEKVLKYYSDSVKNRIESLLEMINSNEKELEEKYEIGKKELQILDNVLIQI